VNEVCEVDARPLELELALRDLGVEECTDQRRQAPRLAQCGVGREDG
jgi:hypothetical protein